MNRNVALPCRPLLNVTEHRCNRCGQVRPGNGNWCDDCWYAVNLDGAPEALPASRPSGEVTACQGTLF